MEQSNSLYVKGRTTDKGNVQIYVKGATDASVIRMPSNVQIGKTLQGQVVSMVGEEVELLLQGNTRIFAKLDPNMQVTLGQLINFEVQKNDQTILLRPLFENVSQDKNIEKALIEAKLPITEKNIQMVDALMHKGMPINRQALVELNQIQVQFPHVNVGILAEMKSLQIPITNQNISQYISYQGTEHYIFDALDELTNEVMKVLHASMEPLQANDEQSLPANILFRSLMSSLSADSESMIQIKQDMGHIPTETDQNQISTDGLKVDNSAVYVTEDSTGPEDQGLLILSKDNPYETKDSYLNNLKNLLLQNATSDEQIRLINKAGLEPQKLLQTMVDLMKEENDFPEAEKLLSSKPFEQTLRSYLEQNILLSAEQFKEKEMVQESFRNLSRLLNSMDSFAEKLGKSGEDVLKSSTNIQQNLDFMNHINQMYSYLQIPIKNADLNGKGELFVYAKKKGQNR